MVDGYRILLLGGEGEGEEVERGLKDAGGLFWWSVFIHGCVYVC